MIQAGTSIVAVVISVITLVRDHKLNKDNSRPYVMCTVKPLTIQGMTYCFLILENFGRSGAYITDVCARPGLKSFFFGGPNNPFSHMKDQMIAPNQSYVACLCILGKETKFILKDEQNTSKGIEEFEITVKYRDLEGKEYDQTTRHSLTGLKDLSILAPEPGVNSQNEISELIKAIYVSQAEKMINEMRRNG